MSSTARVPVLQLAPWVDYGGSDKGTIDWFRWLDRDCYVPSLITTQPSANRRLHEVLPYAEEVWTLPDLMAGAEMPAFIFDFLHSRRIELLHVMNSRLGFELLPELNCLERPPRVVVQLHVEETDRSGYVRYVTTRYGNLVDAFSVTSQYLAEAVHGYGISWDKIRVIHTGVDAEEEFSPERTGPVAGLDRERVQILYPGRLVEQKDPLLMVEVAARLRDRGHEFQIQVVGEGELEGDVRRRVADLRLAEQVRFHPATNRLVPWYAASDLLLMTSIFEGVPYVVFEAMAMGLPVVSPALPGNVELLGDVGGQLIRPRDDVDAYVAALGALLESPERRDEVGRSARERVSERFSVQRMADEHVRLYHDLGAGVPKPRDDPGRPAADQSRAPHEQLTPLRFRNRSLHDTPLVSLIVPCFNHGMVLAGCLDAIRAQTYPAVETIVVDDASTERETLALLDELERDPTLTTIRLSENGGPSRARNVGLEGASGRYVLPVDSDNVLLADAIERLVAQLRVAGEEVGFVYPNVQYFGNREDYYRAPGWDLYGLLQQNACDVCSLFDGEIFAAGLRFDESIRLGHEDWEFVLQLAAHGVRGEPAHGKTLLYRKWGFNRSDAVEYAAKPFHETVRGASRLTQTEQEIKAEWSPSLSLIALADGPDIGSEAGQRLVTRLCNQSCVDVELIARFDGEWPDDRVPPVTRLPPALAVSPGAALVDARQVARGRYTAVSAGTGSALLADRGFVERVLRLLGPADRDGGPLEALVLVDAGADKLPFSLVADDSKNVGTPHTVIWPVALEDDLRAPVAIDAHAPVPTLIEAFVAARKRLQWRHLADAASTTVAASDERVALPLTADLPEHPRELLKERVRRKPWLPGKERRAVPRWLHTATWMPPQTAVLCRHRESGGDRRIVTCERLAPPDYDLEYDLGSVRLFSLQGTSRLVASDGGGYATVERGAWMADPEGVRTLGYVEDAAFPLLEALVLALHRPTGEQVLVCGPWDPLLGEVDLLKTLGFVEPFPISPRRPPHAERSFGLAGLTVAVDRDARRHRYAVGSFADGELVGELGALLTSPQPGTIPLWISDGLALVDGHAPPARPVRPAKALRWTLAPASWDRFSAPLATGRAVARRSGDAALRLARGARRCSSARHGAPAGWLLPQLLRDTVPLYAAYHPVTGDQLLTRTLTEATDMGYGKPELLGYMCAQVPVTGTSDLRAVAVPWASRYGLRTPRG